MLRLALKIQAIILGQDGSDFRRVFIAEITRDLFFKQVISIRAIPRMRVPREFEKKFNVEFRRFQITDIEHPNFVRAVVKCLRHFFRDERGRRRAKPEIIARRAPIRNVIVNTRAAAARPLARVGKLAHVAVIIVRPNERDIIRQIFHQPIQRQYFFVRTKYLRHCRDVRIDVARKHFALVGDDGFKARGFFAFRATAGHAAVVNAAHADGVNVFKFSIFAHTLFPVFQNAVRVCDEIIIAESFCVPFADVVPQHLFAMRRAHHNAVLIGDFAIG